MENKAFKILKSIGDKRLSVCRIYTKKLIHKQIDNDMHLL